MRVQDQVRKANDIMFGKEFSDSAREAAAEARSGSKKDPMAEARARMGIKSNADIHREAVQYHKDKAAEASWEGHSHDNVVRAHEAAARAHGRAAELWDEHGGGQFAQGASYRAGKASLAAMRAKPEED